MSCFPSSLRLSSPVPSPRPSHLCTSLLALSLFSPLFHRTAVLLPSLRLSVSLSLSQIIAASLSVSCFLLRNLRGKALSVSLFALFSSFFLPLFLNLSQLFFFFCQGCLILRGASKREEELIPNPVFPPKKEKKRESRRFFKKKKSVQLLVLTSCPNRVSVRPALRHPGGVNEGRNTGMEGLYLVGGVKRVLRGMIRAL